MPDLADLPRILERVIGLAMHAGRLIEAELARPEGPRGGGDKAQVDIEIEGMLRPGLMQLLECDFAGEETGISLSGDAFCWVVDPNDGTADFLQGTPGSAVAIGLLHNGLPVLGVVYAPVTDRGRDCIAWAQGLPTLLRNFQPVERDLSSSSLTTGTLIFVSTAAASKPHLNAELCQPASFYPMPSIAYRLARVAAGDGVAAVSLYNVSTHDVVAAHALLRAVHGDIWDERGQPLRYKSPAHFMRSPQFCFGGAPAACAELMGRPWQSVLMSDSAK